MNMILPKFLCVGTEKSGTTSLHDILIQDPQIFLPECKETKFFTDSIKYDRGINYYCSQYFSTALPGQLVGEVDGAIAFHRNPKDLYDLLGPDLKLIFMLRNPIKRALSHYYMANRYGRETLSFDEAVSCEMDESYRDSLSKRVSSKIIEETLSHKYITKGYYSKQIKNYLKFFPIQNMFFVLFEDDFINNPEKTITDLYGFLGLEKCEALNCNIQSNKQSLSRSKFISRLYRTDVYPIKMFRNFINSHCVSLKKLIIEPLMALNQKSIKDEDRVSDDFLIERCKMYYTNEFDEIESLIGKQLHSWRSFIS